MTFVLAVAFWLALAGPSGGPATPGLPAVQVTSNAELPREYNRAVDVRWATGESVYIANATEGSHEIALEPLGRQIKEVIPGRFKPGGFVSYRLAVSPPYLVAAAYALALTWRRLDDPTRYEEPVEFIQGIDVWRDRLLLVGARRDEKGNFAPDGAIAWIGSLDKKLSDLKPLLYDSKGPIALTMNACGSVHLGAARFFADGSFAVLPGVQPGLHFFDREARLVRTVDTVALGIDSDCGSLPKSVWERLAAHYPTRVAWINQRRTVDTMLVLPQGIGLVVRSVESGKVRWRLEVVKPDGTTASYKVPIEAPDEFFHLRGDVRDGKIVFLMFQTPPTDSNFARPRLMTALVPRG
jgi:hypothetical protein